MRQPFQHLPDVPSAPTADEYMDDRQLAALVNVNHKTPATWRARNEGPPFVRLGLRMCRYRRADVEKWLAERTNRTPADLRGEATREGR
jgi:predicted DNA-binding transcriptional regulator AlpA